MNALQATIDLIPSSPTLSSIGNCAVSGWGAIAAAISSVGPSSRASGEREPLPESSVSPPSPSQDGESGSEAGASGLSQVLITRIRSHSCSSPGAARDLPWPTSPVLQTQLPPQALPRSKSYTASLCDTPRSDQNPPREADLSSSLTLPSRSTSPVKSLYERDNLQEMGPPQRHPAKSAHPSRPFSTHTRAKSEHAVPSNEALAQTLQRPSSRASILASASRAMNGSPRLPKLAPVKENDDIDGGFMLPPPRTRTMTMRSTASTTSSSSVLKRHARSQSSSSIGGGLLGVLGLMERNNVQAGLASPTSPQKSSTTTAVSSIMATCLDNIDVQAAAEQQRSSTVQFRNPFAPVHPGLSTSSSGRSIHTALGAGMALADIASIPSSATMPDLSAVLAAEAGMLMPPRVRTISSCSSKAQPARPSAHTLASHSLPVSNSGVIELQPSATFYPPNVPRPWLQVKPHNQHHRTQSISTFTPSSTSSRMTSPRPRVDPIFNTASKQDSHPVRPLGRVMQAAGGGGSRRANSLPRGYLPQYKEFREPVPASVMSSPRSAQAVFRPELSAQQTPKAPSSLSESSHRAALSEWNETAPLYTLSHASPERPRSLRAHTSSKRTELLRPIDTELANRKRGTSRRGTSATDDSSSSPASSFLELPPLSAGTTSSASSTSSASLDERSLQRLTPKTSFFDDIRDKEKNAAAAASPGVGRIIVKSSSGRTILAEPISFAGRERERWESLAFVRGHEPFPPVEGSGSIGFSGERVPDGAGARSAWRAPGSPKKPSSGLAASHASTLRKGSIGSSSSISSSRGNKVGAATSAAMPDPASARQSSLSSSFSFFAWPSRPSSSSIATRSGSDHPGSSGFTVSSIGGAAFSAAPDSEEDEAGAGVGAGGNGGDEAEDDDDDGGGGFGWNSYVSMSDVHSPILERSPVFPTSTRPNLPRGRSTVPVL
ncbi:hypothetical protein OC835_003032 [Tilletia horrida]|nr:hypothetical protein OC835_003032 [Tilletia horrida]